VVDRAWAERYFPGQNPLGKRLHEGGSSSWTTVVGVVGEVKYLGLDQPDQGTVYWPIVQRSPRSPMERFSSRFAYFFVRTAAEPRALLPAVRQVVRRLDPALPLEEAATQDELLRDAVEVPRLLSTLVLGFALVALLLSVVGIYGVMSYFVQQHTREIGIRLALGGRPQAVRRLVVSRGLQVVALGVALGLVAALALSGLLASLLFQVEPTDPRTFLVVATALLTAAFLACLLPARKAAAVDPATTLRAE
ncbi:MAG TPA: FtsX-like permease family protein, partial [Thermoanaerobaculia bacterium]|nr:FtsX-like permease family protein [Thermoanaerobaculia bacterium]